jgi:ectoine hydroxylase-related dioxygenase (phytanoyl-CoA dioxygenase family)
MNVMASLASERRMHEEQRPAESRPEKFARDGFVVLEGWITPSEVNTIRSFIESVLRSSYEASCSRPNNLLVPLRWSDATVQKLLASEHRVEVLREALCADDLRWISGYLSIKEPHSGPLEWHQDWWCWDHPVSFQRPAPQVAVLCYLTDTDPKHGALRLLSGSHLRSFAIHASLVAHSDGGGDESVALENPASDEQPEQVTLSAELGDTVVIDYRLVHGTHANDSDLPRDCVILNFAPSWRALPDDVRAHLIRHPSLPGGGELTSRGSSWTTALLPRYEGMPRDLPLNRCAPAEFQIVDRSEARSVREPRGNSRSSSRFEVTGCASSRFAR